MWLLKVSASDRKPEFFPLKEGKLAIGRLSTNQIVVDDAAASRRHAEIMLDMPSNTVSLRDLDSTNGTYVNRQRISGIVQLQSGDVIRIGKVTMYLSAQADNNGAVSGVSGTHRFTRELVLESLDQHAVSLFDISRQLNTVSDLSGMKKAVEDILKRSLDVDSCEMLMSNEFDRLSEPGFGGALALRAVKELSAEVTPADMFVPVANNDQVIGLIRLQKTKQGTRPFDQRDLQLVVAFSYQASLVIQRIELDNQMRKQEQVGLLLRRFLSPQEADFLLRDYLESGHLPEMDEKTVTIMFADMADSTTLAEQVGARRFAQILSSYYQAATEIVFAHGGIIRYLGDGILAVFMHTPAITNPEERAVSAAIELSQRVNATGALNDNQRFVVRAAVNTGKAMLGYVGTDERAEFTVLGDTVNVAYRMQEVAGAYRVVIGPSTMAVVMDKFKTRRIGAISLRGREKPVQVYEIVHQSDK